MAAGAADGAEEDQEAGVVVMIEGCPVTESVALLRSRRVRGTSLIEGLRILSADRSRLS